ncbi:MAG TPA: DNA polymerase III subunit gamma/tau, partial [Ktedonobacterales bacterium]
MASHSLYRKWRSQTFSDLIGQEPVVRTLLNAVREGRLAHAYLFCGPRGTGKTSAARLLAKAVNCANPHDGEPCNECLSCREITAGTSPDVIEIDAASNTGVDNIRDLRETVNLLTTGGRYRVIVVDETHMLSTQAFNALLKTLEEPPPHVIFVLATTEAHKVLPTIVSRCQRFDFRRHTIRNIIARLRQVAEGEGLELEPAGAELLARAAQGGMRDALSLLDQAMAFCGTRVDAETVRRMLGLADPGLLRTLLVCVAEGRAADGLHLINELVGDGADLRQLNSQLAEEWRALVLARAGADVAAMMDRTDEDARELAELASRFSLEALTACARVFARNETPARGLPVPQLALELSLLECIAIQANGGAATVAAAQASPAERTPDVTHRAMPPAPAAAPAMPLAASAAPSAPAPTPPAPAASVQPSGQPRSEDAHAATPAPRSPEGEVGVAATPREDGFAAFASPAPDRVGASPGPPAGPGDEDSGDYRDTLFAAQERWDLIKQVCKQKSRSVAALLHSARPV